MPVTWIEYKGQKILYGDYRGLHGEALLTAIETEARLVQEARKPVLILDDFTKSAANAEFMARAKALAKAVMEPKTLKCAILGVEGVKKVLLQAYNWFTGAEARQRVFDSELAAKEWLVSVE